MLVLCLQHFGFNFIIRSTAYCDW